MIRANFGINPEDLSIEKWAELYNEALWIEGERLKNTAEMIARLFSDKRN